MLKITKKDYIGWLGVICLLVAYFGMTIDVLNPKETLYNLISLSGGTALAWRVWQDKNLPNFIFELIFISIAIANIIMIIVR